ncbi:MAG: S41 family peptidase [Prevotella sp.]|nr:S41 family peptidase [Prevotella sp.]MDY2634239.1 S41 family peptidase [Prevotella sp.]
MSMIKSKRFMPLMLAVSMVIGIVIGSFYANHFSGNRLSIIHSGSNRLNNLLRIIDDQYVDTINIDDLVEKAMPLILSELDPHSVYISAKDVQATNDDLKGSFSGIGVEFIIRDDTIRIQNVISGGPAESAGVLAGDKIVSVDGKPFVGKMVTEEEAKLRLKGPKGSKVTIGVMRYRQKKVHTFTIRRDDIETKSIAATYMIDQTTGYIRIKNFGEKTYYELLTSLAQLSQEGFSNLIIDLRDNSGGLMKEAIRISNEFLPANRSIVYTEGRKSPRQDYRSDGRGSYQKLPLVILINEGSASASEIFAGAMQDNDRATIIGRRSFGKGLVQQQIEFSDHSMIRLTIARYYTPSGRSIQKPYTDGNDKNYEEDLLSRYRHGEFFSQDSIRHTGPAYKTANGRLVYGGGGITPDIFVPEDTLGMTSYYKEAVLSGLMSQFTFQYTDDNRPRLSTCSTMDELLKYIKRQNIVQQFVHYAAKNGLQRRNLLIQKSHRLLERFLNSRLVYTFLGENEWVKYINLDDSTIKAALDVFRKKAAFPQGPGAAHRDAANGNKTSRRTR